MKPTKASARGGRSQNLLAYASTDPVLRKFFGKDAAKVAKHFSGGRRVQRTPVNKTARALMSNGARS